MWKDLGYVPEINWPWRPGWKPYRNSATRVTTDKWLEMKPCRFPRSIIGIPLIRPKGSWLSFVWRINTLTTLSIAISMVFLSQEDLLTFQKQKTALDPFFKHREEGWKCDAKRSIFDEVRGVWKCGHILSWVFDISYQSKLNVRWYVPQNIPKILFTDGGESSIVGDCTRE